MKLSINLATRRYINLRQLSLVLATSIVVLAAILVYLVREIAGNQVEINKVKIQSAAASRGPAGAPPVPAEQMKALDGRIAFANSVIKHKTMNWLSLLDKLEQVVPAGVSFTLVDPSNELQGVKLSGVALSFANLRTLLENMEQSPDFSEVYLLTQSEQKVGTTQKGNTFSLSCKVRY